MSGAVNFIGLGVAATRSWTNAGALLLLLLGIAACGGGGGQTPASPSSPSAPATPPQPPLSGRGTLIVSVLDPIGVPAAGARVIVQPVGGTTLYRETDATGQVELTVASGRSSVYATAPGFAGQGPDVDIASGATVRVSIATRPRVDQPAGGIANAFIDDVSADGRTVQVSLGLFAVNGVNGVDSFLSRAGKAQIEDCAPDPSNDITAVRADCVSGPAGFDAGYAGTGPSQEVYVEWTDGQGGFARSFETLLLLDQAPALATSDPADRRLLAAKYLLSLTSASAAGQRRVALGAFAADDVASGRYSALPQKPLTLFPLENPQLTTDGRSFFPIVDSLATLEGGAGALLPAVDRGLDFMGANAWSDGRGMVVIGSSADEGCGSASDCIGLREAVISKSKALGVHIVTIGLAGPGSAAQYESMNLLAQSDWGGAALWLADPAQFEAAVADAHAFLADLKPYVRVTFRIESPTAGAFAPGRTVLGKVYFEDCPWDCYQIALPFAVKIP